jgi:hypothetical protein
MRSRSGDHGDRLASHVEELHAPTFFLAGNDVPINQRTYVTRAEPFFRAVHGEYDVFEEFSRHRSLSSPMLRKSSDK